MNRSEQGSYIVGIFGGTASGKSLLANKLLQKLGKESTSILELDRYYQDIDSFPVAINGNYDHPDSIDHVKLLSDLESLSKQLNIEAPCYDFHAHKRISAEVMHPKPIIIIEGLLLLAIEGVKAFLDLIIYVEADPDIRLIRRLKRDMAERGRSVDDIIRQYLDTVKPMHASYVEKYKNLADIHVSTNHGIGDALNNTYKTIVSRLDSGRLI